MKPRKYTHIRVFSEVYVSSSYDYGFHCACNFGSFTWYPIFGDAEYRGARDYVTWTPPQYVIRELKSLIVQRHKAGELTFYEHRQDGSKRYEPLRYHDPEFFAQWIESWATHES